MKLIDRLLLWMLSLLAVILSLLLLLLVLFPSLTWLQVPAVRTTAGALSLLCIFAAVLVFIRRPRQRNQSEAALVNENEGGSAFVTLNVIGDMTKRIAQDCDGVRSCKSNVKNNGNGVDLELEMSLNPGVSVAPMAAMLQERLKDRIYEMTGIRVGKVSIMVEAAGEAKAPKQTAADNLPSRVR